MGFRAHESSDKCRCGKTAICDKNVGMICDGTKCRKQENCVKTDGLTRNEGGCRCGSNVCSRISGYYCLKYLEKCSTQIYGTL